MSTICVRFVAASPSQASPQYIHCWPFQGSTSSWLFLVLFVARKMAVPMATADDVFGVTLFLCALDEILD